MHVLFSLTIIVLSFSSNQDYRLPCGQEKMQANSQFEEQKLNTIDSCERNSLENVLSTPLKPNQFRNDSAICQSNPEAFALLESLGLVEKYPKGLHLQHALQICLEPLKLSLCKKPLTISQSKKHSEPPYLLVLQKLMAYDSLCRSNLFSMEEVEKVEESVMYQSSHPPTSESETDSDSESDSLYSDGIHPVDSLLSLIICSDISLQQDLFSRLANCQIAVPFILPDPFTKELTLPFWGLRSIIKEWEYVHQKGETVKMTQPIVSHKMPIVLFIRFGKHHTASKSAILNEVISDSHYDHFFHYNCDGGDCKLVLGEGLVDMCWYLPGKTSDAFSDAITFLNLHGDARDNLEQLKFLSQISSMCFVLLTEKNLKIDTDVTDCVKRFDASAGGITTLSVVKSKAIPDCLKKVVIDIRPRKKKIPQIKKLIRGHINSKFEFAIPKCKSIEKWCSHIVGTKIIIDEDNETYSLEHATKVKALITEKLASVSEYKHSKSYAKDVLLPLQGKSLWKAWADNNKEIYRQIQRGNKLVIEYTEDIRIKKADLRRRQLEHVESLTPVMKSFIISLLKLQGPSNIVLRNCFLQCLKLHLNSLSRESLSAMQEKYQSVRGVLQTSHKDNPKAVELKKELEDLQEDILDSSLGLEHLLREVGQVYEAAYESGLYNDSLRRLPKAAAELLIDGYPLELMDGDAAHVPQQWVTAVLEETKDMLDDPQVFVLSILGLQSSGKSTLLNTVFGLQFNVSAGRCTRGVFMQLLPLDAELRTQTHCSYILIVDTEGLRAPHLDRLKAQKHDNELATFVIGLANMTLINIYGEVPGDMDDILQTSVHAFLRMTEVKLSPSCQFVHQNVNITTVKSDVEREKFAKKLDQFTVEAAKQEQCEKKFQYFNDVIKFNDQTDVHYFPGLWSGDLPMAPINPGYSHAAQMLKFHLIKIIQRRLTSEETGSDFHLSAFQAKLQDLWEALLKENFVFSFKNTQEITAYNRLETEYSNWDWELRESMLEWELEVENEISTTKPKAASELVREKCKELEDHISCLHKKVSSKMDKFFINSKQKEILIQWKASFERRVKIHMEELKERAVRHCERLGKSREAISRFDQIRRNHVQIITGKIQDHIASIRIEQETFIESLNKRRLNQDQQEKILKRKLFTKENLAYYKEQGIFREDQVKYVLEILDRCSGQLTMVDLTEIMFGGVLELEQVKKIPIRGRQTERELEAKFDDIWGELIQQLPSVPMDESNVELEVETMMIEFVRGQGYERQVITKLQETKTLRKWGTKLEFTPNENEHYNKVRTYTQRPGIIVSYLLPYSNWTRRTTDVHLAEAVEITVNAFRKAQDYLNQIKKQKTDFKQGFTKELLREVDSIISIKSEAVKNHITFTSEYRLTVFLIVCGYAIPVFEEMAKLFRERIDPIKYLEKHVKKTLFTNFKNQYHQTQAEEAIASIFCAHLEVPIKEQIKQTIGATVVGKMRSSKHYFSSKMALKVKILADLYHEDDYEGYIAYVKDVKECLYNRIKQYTMQFCGERVPGGTRLQIASQQEVDRLINVVEFTISEMNETGIQEWLVTFSRNHKIIKHLGNINFDNLLTGFDPLKKINVDNFKLQIRNGLQTLKKNLHSLYAKTHCESGCFSDWKDKPQELLSNLIGCTEQCPFCGEQCDLLDPNHYKDNKQKHRTGVHRPACLAGWRDRETQVMESDFCTSLVSDKRDFLDVKTGNYHPFKQYDSIFSEWSIPPDPSSETCLYWKWFVGKYSEELAVTYGAKPVDIPIAWLNIKWPEVVKSFEYAYKVRVPQ